MSPQRPSVSAAPRRRAVALRDPRTSTDPRFRATGGARTSLLTRLGPAWPLTVLFAGFPLWWLLGLSNVIPFALAIPMIGFLIRHRRPFAPPGFALWLLFLVWVAAGVLVLWANAPDAVAGGGASRLFIFGYRLAWYLCATVVLLFVGNLSEEQLPKQRLARLLGGMFIITVLGGILGIVLPNLEITTPTEVLLPHFLGGNSFVNTLVHVRTADTETFLGFAEARPVAPYPYANTWGANFAMFLPFFIISWCGKGAGWRRRIAPVVLLASLAPAVYSLNRGLWIALVLMGVFLLVRLALSGRVWVVGAAVAVVVVASLVFLASPLGSLLQTRINTPHSNGRRTQLAQLTVQSAASGSPVAGFGSTRAVQGSFFSIAGGATPDCPGCKVPPLGTQGQLWLLIFSQGLVGAALFIMFFAYWFIRHVRDRSSPFALAMILGMLACIVFLFVYEITGLPLYTLMVAMAVVWRLERSTPTTPVIAGVGSVRLSVPRLKRSTHGTMAIRPTPSIPTARPTGASRG